MELDVTQTNLAKALNTVARVAGGRSTLPILNNVLLKINKNQLSISATNLDIAITEHIGAKIKNEGTVTVPARLTQDFVGSLPSETIHIKQDDHKLHITTGSYDSTINGVAADEFPVMPEIKNGITWEVPVTDFKQALQQVVFAASSDEARPVLTGVYLHTKAGSLYVAATDSYRLAEKQAFKTKQPVSLLIPATALQDLLRIIHEDEEMVRITHDEQQVRFVIGNTELVARLIEGNYPDYQKLIPAQFAHQATLAKDELINITKVSSLFAREAAGSITLEVNEKKAQVSVRSVASQVGENTATAEASIKGSGEITLNSRYLLDGLQAITGDKVVVGFNGKLEPVVLRASGDQAYTHIVMPLKS